jgi:hypothetical protein
MWQYEVLGLDAAHEMMTLYERLQKMGDQGWELVCILDQSKDEGLKDSRDARMLLFKKPKKGGGSEQINPQ